jgi:DNA-binding transcriptional ArsR family regulator
LEVTPSSLQRELRALTDAGILRRRREGNRVYFQANPDCPFLGELQSLLTKTVGVVEVLRKALTPCAARIDWAFIYGSMARAEALSTSDVDLMIVGEVGLAELTPALRRAEKRLSRPVNPTLYSHTEFVTKLTVGHHFLKSVIDGEKLFVLGSPHELQTVISGPPGARARHQPQRA